jgi:lysozyme
MKGRLAAVLGAAVTIATPLGAYYEGAIPRTYVDPIGITTGCLGETGKAADWINMHTMAECVVRYSGRLRTVGEQLDRCIDVDVAPNEAAALISFADNIGVAATCGSTMVRMLNAGAGPEAWCGEMLRWNKARKFGVLIVLPGLQKRRAAEMKVCLGDLSDWTKSD